ncbi:MAG TPA: CPBP family intramembrane glutamic endopeptidase [Bryobacteraceae bacterium]|nr:CPBP family intramembrane glutamic endopeptidase [Bryobacteraceae bacterium]
MNALDHVLFAAICAGLPLLDWLWMYPRFVRATAERRPGARERGYAITMLSSWGLMACVLALWIALGRPLDTLRLGIGYPMRGGIGLALAALYALLAWAQKRAVLKQPDAAELVRRQLGKAEALMPRSAREYRLFMLVAITAGICEEILFRGFVMWYLTVWTSAIPAALISSVLFGLAHTYIGIPHVIRSAIVGAVLAALVLGTGSLWAAMALHAVIDLSSGDLVYRTLGRAETSPASAG